MISPDRSKNWRPAIASALLALGLYAVTLGGTYIYDDRYIIQIDPRLNDTSKWKLLWTRDYFYGGADNLYRPLVSQSYAFQVVLHGNDEPRAWAFHLVNWLLGAAVCAVVAEMARRIAGTRVAWIAGLLFAAHPIHVEAVANIVGRAELMCALGLFGAVTIFLTPGPLTIPRVLALWSCQVLAILSKEQGMLLPLVLLAAVPLRKYREAGTVDEGSAQPPPPPTSTVIAYAQDESTRRTTRLSPPALWLVLLISWSVAGYLLLREQWLRLRFWWDRSFLDWTINPVVRSVGQDRWMMPLALLGRYVALLVAPLRLTPDYGGGVIDSTVSIRDPYLYLGAVVILAWVIAFAFALTRRAWKVVFTLFSLAIFYGLIGNVVSLIGINFAERLMFIPSAFFCILVAMAVAKLRLQMLVSIVAIMVILASLRTVTYAARWNDPRKLFETALAEHPRGIRVHLLLAEELQRRKDFAGAQKVLAEGREQFPDYWRYWEGSATLALAMDDLPAALAFYERGKALHPHLQLSWLAQELSQRRAAAATQPR